MSASFKLLYARKGSRAYPQINRSPGTDSTIFLERFCYKRRRFVFAGSFGAGSPPSGEAQVKMTLDSADFLKMFQGELNPTSAFMGGKLKIKGDVMMAMKLEKLMGQVRSKL